MYNMFQMYNICYIYMERGLKDIYDIYKNINNTYTYVARLWVV